MWRFALYPLGIRKQPKKKRAASVIIQTTLKVTILIILLLFNRQRVNNSSPISPAAQVHARALAELVLNSNFKCPVITPDCERNAALLLAQSNWLFFIIF